MSDKQRSDYCVCFVGRRWQLLQLPWTVQRKLCSEWARETCAYPSIKLS
jgi:hypothetical protein